MAPHLSGTNYCHRLGKCMHSEEASEFGSRVSSLNCMLMACIAYFPSCGLPLEVGVIYQILLITGLLFPQVEVV